MLLLLLAICQASKLHLNNKIIRMLDQLKKLATQKLQETMSGNSLGASETTEAAGEGASSLINSIKEKLSSGQLDQVKDLFSQDGESLENNEIFKNVQEKIAEVIQAKGMNAEDAQQEAKATTADVLNGIKEKFASKDEADSAFSLEALTGLLGGNAGDLLNKAKGFLG